MIKTGTDIVEVKRFSQMKNLERFLNKNFTQRERLEFDKYKNPFPHIAGVFAAKEAFSKYLGSGIRGFEFSDIELLHNALGKPYIVFKGEFTESDVSISHTDELAVATVCGDRYDTQIDSETLVYYKNLLPKRHSNMHKGDCGRVFIIAGSVGMTGAACLCTEATLRCGSGLVTLGTSESAQKVAATMLKEAMTLPLPENNGGLSIAAADIIKDKINKSDVCAIGPGLGSNDDIKHILAEVLKNNTPCVIDADGLNALASNVELLKTKNCTAVITPHPGEMSRLTGLDISKIEENRTSVALNFAKEYNTVVVLKGHNTVIASPTGEVVINKTGNSGMASGGMGDVLTGMTASFIGQGLTPFDGAVLAVFLHGLAADLAVEKKGEFGLVARDVVEYIPQAIKYLLK